MAVFDLIDIEDVPGEARTVLRETVLGVNRPRPPIAKRTGAGWVWLYVIGISIMLWMLFSGYGDPDTASQSPAAIVMYVAGIGLIAWGEVVRRRRKALVRALGFTPGVYVIGSRLVDARQRALQLHELMSQKPSIVHRYVNGVYRGSNLSWHGHTFTFPRQVAVQAALTETGNTLDRIVDAAKANDMHTLVNLDPAAMAMVLSKGEQEAAFKRGDRPKARGASKMPAMVALAATAVLSPGAYFVRNHLAVEAAFERVSSVYQADAWERSGGDHARAYHKKMQIELRDAITEYKDNATHLRDVLARYPDAPADLKKPVEDALRARYEAARKSALALTTSDELKWFINQVYDKLEASGIRANMRIKIEQTDNSQLAGLDKFVAEDPKLSKVMVPVAKYFSDESEMTRAAGLQSAVQSGVAKFFPEDVMVFDNDTDKALQARADAAAGLPAADAAKTAIADAGKEVAKNAKDAKDAKDAASDIPEIDISYVIKPSFEDDGSPVIYREVDHITKKPVPGALQYPGVEFALVAKLEIPGGKSPEEMRFTATPAPSITVEHSGPDLGLADSASNADVYHAMSQSAFDDLRVKLVGALGGKVEEPAAPHKDWCPGFTAIRVQMDTCKKLSDAGRKKIVADIKAAIDSVSDDDVACTTAIDLATKKATAAGCAISALPQPDDSGNSEPAAPPTGTTDDGN